MKRLLVVAILAAGCSTMTPETLSVLSDSSLCDYQHDTSQELRGPRSQRLATSDAQLVERLALAKTEIDSRNLDCSSYAASLDKDECTSRTDPFTGITRTKCN